LRSWRKRVRSGFEKGGRLGEMEWNGMEWTCLEDGRALGKKESEHSASRGETGPMGRCRVVALRLVRPEGGRKVGGMGMMEIEAEM
jgi:hypothetical protein